MQGIRNGACDYLVKPVRIQELQNIWQHVVRRNKSISLKRPPPSSIEQVSNEEFNQNNVHDVPCERHKCKILEENSSRGDDMNDDDEQEDSGRDNEESTQPKKPRLFWSVELHQKFVDAVNSLGIEKAFPKKILDMMNVEGLTREKVASHLQKYRLYLRKVNDGTDEASSKISAYENGNIGPLGGGYGVFQSLAGTTTRYPGINQSLFHPAMFGRLNTVAGVSIRGLASSPMLQTVQLSNVNSTLFPLGNFTPNHNGTIFQGFPSLEENEGAFANQSSSNNGALEGTTTASSNLHDPNRYSSNWETSFQSPGHSQAAQHNLLTPNMSGKTLASPMSQMPNVQNDPLAYLCGFSSITDSKENLQTQDYSNGNNISNLNLLGQSHMCPDYMPDCIVSSCNTSVASSSLISDVAPVYQNVNQNNSKINTLPLRHLESSSSQIMQQPNDKQHMKFDDFLLADSKTIGSSSNGGSEYLEDILGKFLKQDSGETTRARDEFDIDPFSI